MNGRRARTRALCFAALFALLSGSAARAGVTTLVLRPEPRPQDAVGFKYRFFVVENDYRGKAKILFGAHRTYTHHNQKTYLFSHDVFNHWVEYERDDFRAVWPPKGTRHKGETGLWIRTPNYQKDGRVGMRTADSRRFPRQSTQVDGIDGLWSTDAIGQMDVTGKEIAIEVHRGGLLHGDLSGWPPAGTLPPGEYRIWNTIVELDGKRYRFETAVPEDGGRYLAPWELASFTSEFFEMAGELRVVMWDFQLKLEGGAYQPSPRFEATNFISAGKGHGYSVRLASWRGRAVLEWSNDGTDTYAKKGDVLVLPDSPAGLRAVRDVKGGVVSAPPAPPAPSAPVVRPVAGRVAFAATDRSRGDALVIFARVTTDGAPLARVTITLLLEDAAGNIVEIATRPTDGDGELTFRFSTAPVSGQRYRARLRADGAGGEHVVKLGAP